MSKTYKKENIHPKLRIQEKLDQIKEEVKKGNCQLKECLFLIQDLWNKEQ